jgi:hypothetical protein
MQPLEDYQYVLFEKANEFLTKVRFVESIRKRLSPKTITTINELGSIIGSDTGEDIPAEYWNLSGALYAYLFLELTKIGIDAAGESTLVGYPTFFPDVSMMNWKNGKPNARYWVLKLIKDNFGPGDKLVATSLGESSIACQAFITKSGKKILFINQRNREMTISLPKDINDASVSYVDVSTGENPPLTEKVKGSSITIKPFAVVVMQVN